MTGSNAVLIVVPIVMLAALGLWLGLVYWVGAHPEWKAHRLAREAAARETVLAAASEATARQTVPAAAGERAAAQAGGQPATPHAA